MTMDRNAFERAFRALTPSLIAYARSLARDPDLAQDLVQETAMRAWRGRAGYAQGTNLKAWLFRILRNCFLTQARRQTRSREESRGDDVPEMPVAPQQEAPLHLQDLMRNWQRLTHDQQRALALVAIDGCTLEEAAAIDGVAVGTVKSRLARGRRTLHYLTFGDVIPAKTVTERETIGLESAEAPMDPIDQRQAELLRQWRERRRATTHALAA
jgi:RNA polymerase sigma-70 factor (ECF subfamily)